MFQFVVAFEVQPEPINDFKKIAQWTGRESLANEPGTLMFELLEDAEDAREGWKPLKTKKRESRMLNTARSLA